MKKSMLFIILALFVLSVMPLICAQEAQTTAPEDTFSLNEAIEKPIAIPEFLKALSGIFIGIGQTQEISLKLLIIITALWVIVFILILQLIRFIPGLNNAGLQYLLSFVITSLIGATGFIVNLTTSFFYLGIIKKIFSLTNKFSFLALLSFVVIFGLLALAVSKLISLVKKQVELSITKSKGERLGRLIRY